MTTKEAANACNVSTETIKRWIKTGKLPAYKQCERGGKGWEIKEEDLIAFRKTHIITSGRKPKEPPIKPAITLTQAFRIKAHLEMIIDILLEGAE